MNSELKRILSAIPFSLIPGSISGSPGGEACLELFRFFRRSDEDFLLKTGWEYDIKK